MKIRLPGSHCTVYFSILSSVTGSLLKTQYVQNVPAVHRVVHSLKQISVDYPIPALLDTHFNYYSPDQHIFIALVTAGDPTDAPQNRSRSPKAENEDIHGAQASTLTPSILQSQIPTDCPEEDEEPWCHECGEGDYDSQSGVFRCRGIADENYRWKGCDCVQESGHIVHRAGEGEEPSDERIGEILDGLPEWTEASYSGNPEDWGVEDGDGREPGNQTSGVADVREAG